MRYSSSLGKSNKSGAGTEESDEEHGLLRNGKLIQRSLSPLASQKVSKV